MISSVIKSELYDGRNARTKDVLHFYTRIRQSMMFAQVITNAEDPT